MALPIDLVHSANSHGLIRFILAGGGDRQVVIEGDIAKYAMWLFHHASGPRERLPALYDHLCRKNPVRSESLSFQQFESLFQQWRCQQTAHSDTVAGAESAAGNTKQPAVCAGVAEPDASGISDTQSSQMLSPDAAPIGDYHVVTEMLIEQLVATVKRYMADGWTPLGGISRASSASSASYWAQAMVRRQVN